MKMINISHGHALPGGIGCGATGYHDESAETKKITEALVQLLNQYGAESYDCSCNKHVDWDTCLNEIIANHNKYKEEDLSVSIHLNYLSGKEKKDGKNKGAEVLVYSMAGSEYKLTVAKRILMELKEAGFTDRGIKVRPDLRFLKKCNSPSILIELYFCDDQDDVLLAEKYGPKGLARMLASAILDTDIRDICYGTKLEVIKKVKIRDSAKADYNQIGTYLPGARLKVISTNKKATRAEIAEGQWITLDSRYVKVVE